MRRLLFQDTDNDSAAVSLLAKAVSGALALSLVCLLALAAFASLEYHWNWSAVFNYKKKFIDGWLLTIQISSASLVVACLIGGLSALAARSRILPLRYLFKLYVEGTRGTPLLVQILLIFYVFADAAHLENRYVVGVLVLSLFSGAYVSEIFRAGIESIGSSQLLSAKAIGFTPYQTFRYIIFPQALRRSLPALAGQFANLIKDSSLLSIIAIEEFTLNAQEVNTSTLSTFESFFPLAVGYLILTLPIFYLSRHLERKLAFDS
ncbi:amino acid ABC transporter permease [Pelagicoccus sp. NFK12]|uniref:Amino acid ABC transporter permease n=1 Tax=Pelagicoccus enzymogenes TaxID=2773457 RepID=A0A927IHT7_9BACT|nr:amino acid ABC transporter permease [Pelagicoccus enzymogenes]MBD5780556.1 amino acid ABC transporter permease [Pelagicoccus enzymogenes]MDQ8199043.1 amino acid ABC transporter permease [Pelagicoccus enzymogenes]